MDHSATYSPEDNKLRLYPAYRLPKDEYDRVKAHGFIWAPKQELFVAPMWTPSREDFLIELCGEVGDEDVSLVERQEQRAERFEDYSDKRKHDAERAHDAVSAIADNIPLGQPILVGHHSEKHARRDADKITNGMRRAVKMWEQSTYWTERAKGAIRHAKYKELPQVRARRIKKIEADKRKQERIVERSTALLAAWERPLDKPMKDGTINPRRRVVALANMDGGYWKSNFEFRRRDAEGRPNGEVYHTGPCSLWDAAGGNIHEGDQELYAVATPEQIRAKACHNHNYAIAWAQRWIEHYNNRLAYERAMLDEQGGTVSDRVQPEKGGGCKCWASPRGGWSYIQKVNKVSVTVLDNWGNSSDADGSRNFTRTIPFDKLSKIITKRDVDEAREDGRLIETADQTGFVLLDSVPEPLPREPRPADLEGNKFEAIKETLKAGIQVVSAPQLFPTPKETAEYMAELLDVQPGDRVLEPSAGTGMLLGALGGRMFEEPGMIPYAERDQVYAVEVNSKLASRLEVEYPLTRVICGDFLEQNGNLGQFDRIIMNPPFVNGADIKHIQHARTFLKPGGKLVALCANGPRQREALEPIADYWEDLPAGTFSEQGTNVNVALLVINAPRVGNLF